MNSLRGRRLIWSAAAGACCVLIGVTALLLLHRGHGSQAPAPVSAADSNARACVLADSNDPALATVDAGLRQAARTGRLNIQHYLVPGTAVDVMPLLDGMIAARCGVVVGVGELADGAIESYAANGRQPAAGLIVVGAAGEKSTNVTVLSSVGLTPDAVAQQVNADLG